MKLYYSKGACSLIVRIILNELGLDYSSEAVDLRTKKTATGEDYLQINPKGSVPALVMDNGELLTENQVIIQYLCDTYHAEQLLPPVGTLSRYRVLEQLNYLSSDLHKGFSPLFNPMIPDDVKAQYFVPALESKLALLDKHLQGSPFMAGDTFTLPDAYLFVLLLWPDHCGVSLAGMDALQQFSQKLVSRPSIAKSLRDEGLVKA